MTPKKTKRRSALQKASGGLYGFAEASKNAGSTLLLGDIRKHAVTEALKHGQDGREKHLLHVSEVAKAEWCPRQSFYKLTEAEPSDPPTGVNYRLETIFATGHDAHAKYQRWLHQMGELWGTWRCRACAHEWVETSPKFCPQCGIVKPEYLEVNLHNDRLKLVGHADGANPRLEAFIEVKTIGIGTVRMDHPALVNQATVTVPGKKAIIDIDRLWANITRPLTMHLNQALFYLWMAREQGLPFKKIIFIYEFKANQDTKEFVVEASDRRIMPILDRLSEVVAAADAGGPVPPRPADFEKDRKPCNACVFRSMCWEKESSDDTSEEGGAVPPRRRRAGGSTSAGATADLPATEARPRLPRGTRRPDRTVRPEPDAAVHAADEVVGVPVDSTGLRGGGRTVRRVSDGEGSRTVISRRREG